jgi:ATP/ADP translocase/HEAT repeat protein
MNLFSMQPGECTRAVFAFSYLFFIIASYLLLKPIRNALFIDEYGAMKLPWVMMGIAVLAGAFAAIYIRLAKRFPTPRLVFWCLIFFASNVLLFWYLAVLGLRWLFPVFYLWTGVFGVIAPMQVWTLASEMFTTREARRLFGFVGAGGILGAIAGGELANWLAEVIGTVHLMLVVLALLLSAAATVLVLARFRNVQRSIAAGSTAPRNLMKSLRIISGSSHLRLLAGLIFITALTTTSVDIQFNVVAGENFQDKDQLTAFFGSVYSKISIVAILGQVLLTSRLMSSVGAGLLILMLPFSLAMGSATLLLSGTLWAGVLLKGSDGALKHSLDRSCRELLYLPVPSHIRAQAKSTIDTVMDRFGDGSAGALQLMLLTILGLGLSASLMVNFLLVSIWLYIALKLRSAYVNQLRLSLGQPRRRSDELPVDEEADVHRTLELLLQSGSEQEKLGALEWAGANAVKVDEKLLLDMARSKQSQPVRNAALGLLLRGEEAGIPPELMKELEAEGQSALVAAIDLLVERETSLVEERLESLLERAGETTRLSIVAFTLRRLGPEFEPFANRVFDELLAPEAPAHARRAAVRALALLPEDAKPHDLLLYAISDPDPTVASAAVDTAGRLSRDDLLPYIVEQLGRPRVRGEVRRCLARFGERAVRILVQTMEEENTPAGVRRQIPLLLGDVGTPNAVSSLVVGLEATEPRFREQCIKALHRMRRRDPQGSPLSGRKLESLLLPMADRYVELQRAEAALEAAKEAGGEPLVWLRDAVENERYRVLNSVFMLMALEYPLQDMSRSWLAMKSGNPREKANAIELLDSLLPRSLKKQLLPLLEASAGGGAESPEAVIRELAAGEDPWLAACAIYVARSAGMKGLDDAALRAAGSDHVALRQEAEAFLASAGRGVVA